MENQVISNNPSRPSTWKMPERNEILNVIQAEVSDFATYFLKILNSNEKWELSDDRKIPQVEIHAEYIFSIQFIGTVYGEYVVSLSKATAENLLRQHLTDLPSDQHEEILLDILSEMINQAGGSRLFRLNDLFYKITLTPPRLARGFLRYHRAKAHTLKYVSASGEVDFFMYIDQMKTDLVDAHLVASENLLEAQGQIQEQQKLLIQSEKMASLGTMAAGVAHEINNPLSFVMSNAEILAQYFRIILKLVKEYQSVKVHVVDEIDTAVASMLRNIDEIEKSEDIEFLLNDIEKMISESQNGMERIRHIVQGLKRFSRQDGSEQIFFQINDEVRNTLAILHNELKYKCEVECSFNELPLFFGNPGELSQVLLNLVINASQAIEGAQGRILISTSMDRGRIILSVRDNGKGIAPEHLDKIFNPFFTTKPVGQGTGLGLSISYGIIAKMNGHISVKSEVGKGTEFTIELPVGKA